MTEQQARIDGLTKTLAEALDICGQRLFPNENPPDVGKVRGFFVDQCILGKIVVRFFDHTGRPAHLNPTNWKDQRFAELWLNTGRHAIKRLSTIRQYDLYVDLTDLESILAEPNHDSRRSPISAETSCRKWLLDLMRDGSTPTKTKAAYKIEAKEKFEGLGDRAFSRAWAVAMESTGNDRWKKPGPRS